MAVTYQYLVEQEGLKHTKSKVGETEFSSLSLGEPLTDKILDGVSQATGIPKEVCLEQVAKRVAETEKNATLAPLLFHTMKHQAVESALFKILWDSPKSNVPNASRFSNVQFQKVIRMIQLNHPTIYPPKGYIVQKRLLNPKIVYTGEEPEPSETPPEPGTNDKPNLYRDVDTAAASPTGEFIFNMKFMQRLLDYAAIKDIKPKQKYYVANGGTIPNGYAYLEFLLMHEFMHYCDEDFYFQFVIPDAKPKLINWVGDFRTNYTLVKSGYEQLPIGLYNDLINLDRQATYADMYKIVKEEFDKLPAQEQDNVGEALDGQTDDHKPGQADGKAKEGEVDGELSKRGETSEQAEKEMGERNKEISDKIKEEAKQAEGKQPPKPSDKKGEQQPKPGQSGGMGSGQRGVLSVDYTKVKPRYSWKELIKKFITSSGGFSQAETYAKPSRRSTTSVDILAQRGVAAVKPGMLLEPKKILKVCVVLDTSGSMMAATSQCVAEIFALVKTLPVAVNVPFIFGDKAVAVTPKSGTFHEVTKRKFPITSLGPPQKLTNFTSISAGGQELDNSTTAYALEALKAGYNILIVTDSDVIRGSNLTNLRQLLAADVKKVFLVLRTRGEYVTVRQTLGGATTNMSHLPNE